MACIEHPSLAACRGVHQKWGTMNPHPTLIQTVGFSPSSARSRTYILASRRGDQPSRPPQGLLPPAQGRLYFEAPQPHPGGVCRIRVGNRCGFGYAEATPLLPWGRGQPAGLSPPGSANSHQQILPAHRPASETGCRCPQQGG